MRFLHQAKGDILPIIILPMHHEDIKIVAKIHALAFPRQHSSEQWINSSFNAYPKTMMFVARNEQDDVIGYIQWTYKSRFRKETVIELEQLAVLKQNRRQGIATKLINQSLTDVKVFLSDTRSKLKSILISTHTDNEAQTLYIKALNARPLVTIKNLYSAAEVLMIADSL